MTPVEQMIASLDGEDRAMAEHAHAVGHRIAAHEIEMRRLVLRFGAVLCDCPPYFAWDERRPPQAACAVHGTLVIAAPELGGQVIM